MKIFVKNMACESCKIVVKDALDEMGIPTIKVALGEIETEEDISDLDKKNLSRMIKNEGFELLENKQVGLIEKIRKIMIDYVYESDEKPNIKFSVLLNRELHQSYAYLSNLFSEIEATLALRKNRTV